MQAYAPDTRQHSSQQRVVAVLPVVSGLELDLDAARRFLAALDPSTDRFNITTLPDGPAHRQTAGLMTSRFARIDDIADDLALLNCRAATVCVTANRTDGHGRKTENIAGIRCVFADWDDGLPVRLPLEPTVIVETSPGRAQAWWLIALGDPMELTTFASIMYRLVADYGADPQAKDAARILRIPGFLHQKNPNRPHLVRVIGGSRRRYRTADLIAAFPPIERPAPVPRSAVVLDASNAGRMRRYAIRALQAETEALARMIDGRRNAVFLTACKLAKFAAHSVLSSNEITAPLLDAWRANGGEAKHGRSHALGCIRRGLALGVRDPLPQLDQSVIGRGCAS